MQSVALRIFGLIGNEYLPWWKITVLIIIFTNTDLQLRFATGMNSSAIMEDVVRDEEIRISCNASFSDFRPVGGPVVIARILRIYWTSERNDTSNNSSNVLVKAPKDGVIPPYTCNVVCDFYTNIPDLSGDSSMELSFNTNPLKVLCKYTVRATYFSVI